MTDGRTTAMRRSELSPSVGSFGDTGQTLNRSPATPPPTEKTLLRLALELKNLIRGDRVFRANRGR